MLKKRLHATRPTGIERPWTEDELIVTKTDTKGIITYANEVFLRMAQLTEDEALGAPHNVIRHPNMPRAVFKLLWDTLEKKKEIFAFVNNMAMSGDNYWVFAHVTPSFDARDNVTGYHSNRRKPSNEQIQKIAPIYATLLQIENSCDSPKDGLSKSYNALVQTVKNTGMTYDEFIFTI
jgi:PAS domain S-box-containing protein